MQNGILLTMHIHTGVYMIDNEIKLVELNKGKKKHISFGERKQ